MKFVLYLVLMVISIANIVGYAEPVSQADLEKAAVGAVQYLHQNGLVSFSLDTEVDYIDHYVSAKGYNLNIVVLKPKGFVVLSSDYEQEVIVHFSENDWHQNRTRLLDAFNVRSDKPEIDRKIWASLLDDADSSINLRRQPRASSCTQPSCKQLTTVNWEQTGTMSSNSVAYNSAMRTLTLLDGSTMLVDAGCVATAMGIIMNYHQYPSHSPVSGIQYNWSNTSFDSSLATLMRELNDIGNASYNSDGTGMTEIDEDNTLRYFGYELIVNPVRKANNMYDFAKGYIDNDYPLLLGGYEWEVIPFIWREGFNHEVVVDGYKKVDALLEDSLYFRINFGWGGAENGWWQVNRLYDLIWSSRLENKRLVAAIPPYKFWSGNASIISYHGKNANKENYDYPYGITRDEVALHPRSNGQPVAFFQWQVSKDNCDRLKIDVEESLPIEENNMDIIFGAWDTRNLDQTFEGVTLPFVIGESNTGYTFTDIDSEWYMVGVAFRNPVSNPTLLDATCVSEEAPTDKPYTTGQSIILYGKYKWNASASIISGLFTPQSNESRYGVFKDAAKVHPSPEKPVLFFQWMASDVCPTLTIDAPELNDSEKSVQLGIKKWNDNSYPLNSVTLPHTLKKKGIWNLIKVAFENPVSQTATLKANCPGY